MRVLVWESGRETGVSAVVREGDGRERGESGRETGEGGVREGDGC